MVVELFFIFRHTLAQYRLENQPNSVFRFHEARSDLHRERNLGFFAWKYFEFRQYFRQDQFDFHFGEPLCCKKKKKKLKSNKTNYARILRNEKCICY